MTAVHRQFDIEFLQTIDRPDTAPQLLTRTVASVGVHRAVTGIQKLVQRYVLVLITSLGSVRFDSKFGTDFWRDIYRGAAQNRGRLRAAFAFASLRAARLIREDDRLEVYGELQPDETLATARLVDFNMDTTTGTLYLSVAIESAAGDSYEYAVPVAMPGSS